MLRFPILALLPVVVEHCLGAQLSAKQPRGELEALQAQVDQAAEQVNAFSPTRIWAAYEVIGKVLEDTSLRRRDRNLAARAHRVMAGVYFAASTIVGPGHPGLSGDERRIHKAVRLLEEGGWGKAAPELEESLRLDSRQAGASELRKALRLLSTDSISLPDFGWLIRLLTLSIKKNPQDPAR